MSITRKVAAFAARFDLLPNDIKILAAVSGGKDSMVMLEVLRELSASKTGQSGGGAGARICVAHFNHRLRGAESDRDAEFVRNYCEARGIECEIGYGEALSGDESSAREQRYAFLQDIAKKCGADLIATAHNCDDNAETMLLNLARGAGTRGLAGIPLRRGNIVRPLLCVTRAEIEEYITVHDIPFVEDSTNASDIYNRNKLRLSVLPVMRELNPAFALHALEAAERLREDDSYLTLAAEKLENSAEKLRQTPRALAVRKIASFAPQAMTAAQIAAVLDMCAVSDGSAYVDVRSGRIVREYDTLSFTADDNGVPAMPNVIIRDGGIFGAGDKVNKSLTHFLFKKSEICGTIIVNPRSRGDEITLFGRKVTKSVKKLLIEAKIPAARRDTVPIICDDIGVLAVGGVARSDRAVPSAGDEIIEIILENKE